MRLLITITILILHATSGYTQIVSQGDFSNYELGYNADDDWDILYDGSPYLYEDWHRTKVVIAADTLTYNKGRYNLVGNFLEVMHKGEHKFIKPKYISSFQHKGNAPNKVSTYTIGAEFAFEKKAKGELTQITIIGDIKAITAYQATIRKQSKENPQLSGTGDKDRIIIKRRNYILDDSGLHYIKKSKDLSKRLDIDYKTIKKNIKGQDIDLSSHEGLVFLLSLLDL